MQTTITTLAAKLDNGKELTLRPQVSGYGNTYWAALAKKKDGTRHFSKFGVKVTSNIIGAMPAIGSKVTLLGTSFTFEQKSDKDGTVRPGTIVAKGHLTVPGHGKKEALVQIRDTGDGEFNLIATVRGISAGGKKHALDEL